MFHNWTGFNHVAKSYELPGVYLMKISTINYSNDNYFNYTFTHQSKSFNLFLKSVRRSLVKEVIKERMEGKSKAA